MFTFKTTPDGFDMRLVIAWKPIIAFTRNAIITTATLTALLSTPAGAALLALGRKLLGLFFG